MSSVSVGTVRNAAAALRNVCSQNLQIAELFVNADDEKDNTDVVTMAAEKPMYAHPL